MNRILELVQSGDFDPVEEFTGNKDKFSEVKTAFENISNNLPKQVCINFVLTKIAPTVFDKNVPNGVRDEAVEVGLHVLQFVNIAILTTKEQEEVFSSIEEAYVKVVGELRDGNYSNWDKLWIFLIKLCSDRLHAKMGVANKLLRVVEVAFRNSTSIEQRLKAYDCWVELINNSSLNMQHMCSARQIKLLVTPMKAKFSRMPVVIMKRCDTFVYLLEKLGDKATLCLREFLEFCFGPFDEKNDAEKMKQGRSVSEVCNKSTLVLLEIIGHSHSDSENCLKNDDLNLYKPLITDDNFPSFAEILINSIMECCVLLNEWSQDASTNSSIIKCLWRSVLQFVQKSNDDVKRRCYFQINNSLRKLSERSHYNDYLHTVLGNLIELLIQDEMAEKLKETVFDVSINLLHHFTDPCSFNLDNIQNFVTSCFDVENGSKFDKIASNSFKNNLKCENSILCEVWLKCKITIVPDNISNYVWPIHNLENFENLDVLKSKWTKLYTTECKSEGVKLLLMQNLEKLFLDNPLLSSNIVQFLELMSSGETNPSKDFVAKFMRLMELVLTLPNLSDDNVKAISSIVLKYCNQSQNFYKSENIDETLDKLCGCLEHLVTIHKDYTILTKLAELLSDAQPKVLSKFSKGLLAFLEALMLNEDNSIANNTRKLIELFETKTTEQEIVPLTSSRSLRIMNMANNTHKSRTNNVKVSPAAPLKTKQVSSPRGKSRFSDSKKKNALSINEDNSADYVKIDTKVKINVDNLSEHQKEMFKKRREDIPALYQELTQSQSEDFFTRIEKIDDKESDKKAKEDEARTKSTKKRRRSDEGDEEHAAKTRKVEEKTFEPDESLTPISDEMDPDLRKIFDDVELEPVQKTPPEELFQDPIPEQKKVDTSPNKIAAEESPKDELVENHVDENKSNKSSDIVSNSDDKTDVGTVRVSPRSAKTKKPSPEKTLRKSQRNTAKKIREELVNAVKKQLEQLSESETNDENDTTETEKKNDLNGRENGDVETTLRKSTRQIKKRHSDYLETLKKKKSEDADHVKENQSSDDLATKSQPKRDVNKKKQKRQSLPAQLKKKSDEDESIEDLLARVDKRIEESKKIENPPQKRETKVPDGNDNEIDELAAVTTDETTNKDQDLKKKSVVKKEKKRQSLPVTITPVNTDDKVVSSVSLDVTADTARDTETPPAAVDVYEFKADEEAVVSDEAKKKKKQRRKGMAFNRRDYISKRRKKPKKETRDEGFPFHITADSPVPLSQSSSLRAVASSQTSETITILITRSPPDSRENQENHSDSSVTSNGSPSSPKKKNKRKQSPNSEDFIESSQAPVADKSCLKSKFKGFRQTTIEESMQVLQPEKDAETETMDLDSVPGNENKVKPLRISKTRRFSLTEPSSQKVDVGKRLKRSRSLEKLDFASELITFSLEKVTKEEVHVNDTSLDTLTCDSIPSKEETPALDSENLGEVDTLTLSPVRSPTKQDLPGSPVTCDTPERTTELLNNTSDISPISSTSEVTTPKQATNEVSNRRVARLLQMVNSNVQVSTEGRRWFGNKVSSPSSGRIRKIRMKKEENLDILTFSREVPSPLTVPASGILKRKFNNVDEVATPSPKRKRVNFSDPAITDKKLFIKDAEEYEIDQKTYSTNESQVDEADDLADTKKTKEFLDGFERDSALLTFRDFCDSNFKNTSLDDTKTALKHLLHNLQVPEVVEIITEYLGDNEIKNTLTNESCEQIVDRFVVPLVENVINFEDFLPKLLKVVEKLPNDRLQRFIDDVTAVFGDRINHSISAKLTQEQVEEHVLSLSCDKVHDLMKTYCSNLEQQQRNEFLVGLMNLASDELPFNKEFLNSHVTILQNFVSKMTD